MLGAIIWLLGIFSLAGAESVKMVKTRVITCATNTTSVAGPEYFWLRTSERVVGAHAINICKNTSVWDGFHTKFDALDNYLAGIDNDTIIFYSDAYDTFFNINSHNDLLDRFNIARKGFGMVVSTEFNCNMDGRACTQEDINKYYSTKSMGLNFNHSRAIFLNSGAFAGYASTIQAVLRKCHHHFDHTPVTLQDDQTSFHEYMVSEPKPLFVLDYSWTLFGSMHIVVPMTELSNHSTWRDHSHRLTCVDNQDNIHVDTCVNIKLHTANIWNLDQEECVYVTGDIGVHATVRDKVLTGLDRHTGIWHGQSHSKSTFDHHTHKLITCLGHRENAQKFIKAMSGLG